MFCVPACFLYPGATIVSFFNWKTKTRRKCRIAFVERITGEKFHGFCEEKCNCV